MANLKADFLQNQANFGVNSKGFKTKIVDGITYFR
jgi:hypothetical protein